MIEEERSAPRTREHLVKIAYFDCPCGIAGDMTLAALVDAGVDPKALQAVVARLGLPATLEFETVKRCGMRATYAKVIAAPEHAHRHLHHIEAIIDRAALTERQAATAKAIFHRLGEAEAEAHGIPIAKVHFHEVGAVDSIVDIVAAAVGLDLLGVERIEASPVPTGSGYVTGDHGRMPVPTPATAILLRGVPLAPSTIEAELTTPTGAAILKSLSTSFGPLPAMTVERIGSGAGTKDFPGQANIVRLFVGEVARTHALETVWMLETNLDDVSGETLGYVFGRLFAAGALDVFYTTVFMKKNRPGVMISVLTPENAISALEEVLFTETPSLGIRRQLHHRRILPRQSVVVSSSLGPIPGKLSWHNSKAPHFSPEFDACAAIAEKGGLSLAEVVRTAERAFETSPFRSTPRPAERPPFTTATPVESPRLEGHSHVHSEHAADHTHGEPKHDDAFHHHDHDHDHHHGHQHRHE
jgi:uncharacterized protein (TIGR00299 family) protein